MTTWSLECSACGTTAPGDALASLCPACAQPLFARYDVAPSRETPREGWSMWRYAAAMPLGEFEAPVTLGEGCTPLQEVPALARAFGVKRVWVKDEAVNPTASFKARGLSAAVTRARALGVPGLTIPTAGNAGAALAAYGAAGGVPVRVFAPASTPAPILGTIRALGADLQLVDGHIGDAGRLSRAFAAESGYFDVSTLREPYRVEGNKTMGMEIAEQLGWCLPTHIVYPTGGGEGVIGIWKAFHEMLAWGWILANTPMPRFVVAQAEGCMPIVRAFDARLEQAAPWENPSTHASGIRVPGPLGDRLLLRILKETRGTALAVGEDAIREGTSRLSRVSGVDAAPEGGCALAVTERMAREGMLPPDSEVVIFNTGSGASYRW